MVSYFEKSLWWDIREMLLWQLVFMLNNVMASFRGRHKRHCWCLSKVIGCKQDDAKKNVVTWAWSSVHITRCPNRKSVESLNLPSGQDKHYMWWGIGCKLDVSLDWVVRNFENYQENLYKNEGENWCHYLKGEIIKGVQRKLPLHWLVMRSLHVHSWGVW